MQGPSQFLSYKKIGNLWPKLQYFNCKNTYIMQRFHQTNVNLKKFQLKIDITLIPIVGIIALHTT